MRTPEEVAREAVGWAGTEWMLEEDWEACARAGMIEVLRVVAGRTYCSHYPHAPCVPDMGQACDHCWATDKLATLRKEAGGG